MSVLGKFSTIYLDPPWDIRMDLPYGTLTDKELLFLDLEHLSDDGLIFMWVTGLSPSLSLIFRSSLPSNSLDCIFLWIYPPFIQAARWNWVAL
jgi:hypothetical protein